ncbi:MAG: hypothetical protein GEU73_13605, partial [Chloroflexi bacterium]|nr:hypothetical protein [Chloroflexota bacterium]
MAELMERDGGTEGYYPEVTTLVGTPTDLHIQPIEQDWGVGMDDVQFVIATEELPYVMAQRRCGMGRHVRRLRRVRPGQPGRTSL